MSIPSERGVKRVLGDRDAAFVERVALGNGNDTVLIKDSIDVAGVPTRQGSRILEDAEPALRHAEVVARLLGSGAWHIVGKGAMHELAFGVTGINAHYGTPLNPAWPDRIPGGSSSGCASAVASGSVTMALGTDTGGSVRMPAACCGVIGFKPTYGLVSRAGVHPAVSSLDCVGVLARSVAVIERAMMDLAPGFEAADGVDSASAVVLRPPVDRDVGNAFEQALVASGLRCVSAEMDLDPAFEAGLVIIGHENWKAFGALVRDSRLGDDVRGRLLAGREHDVEAVAAAELIRTRFTAEVDALLNRADVIALPALPIVPPTLEAAGDARACVPLTRLVRPFNLSGHPAISLPLKTEDGLPAALQLVGRRGDDVRLLNIARTVAERFGIEEEF